MLPRDLREFIELLNSNGVEYAIVGGYAVAFHARPRYTGDIGFLARRTPENAERILRELARFGFGSLGLTAADFLKPDCIVQLRHPPNRIDVLTSISGVETDDVWEGRVDCELDGLPVHFIGRLELIRNMREVG